MSQEIGHKSTILLNVLKSTGGNFAAPLGIPRALMTGSYSDNRAKCIGIRLLTQGLRSLNFFIACIQLRPVQIVATRPSREGKNVGALAEAFGAHHGRRAQLPRLAPGPIFSALG